VVCVSVADLPPAPWRVSDPQPSEFAAAAELAATSASSPDVATAAGNLAEEFRTGPIFIDDPSVRVVVAVDRVARGERHAYAGLS
jgi:hypothetical protein